jgi:DNA-binding CsgD family transcriptional regulator
MKADGRVVVGRKVDRCPWWVEEKYYPWELEMAVYDLDGQPDVYLTQNRFSGNRRLVQDVSALSCLYADLDYYNVPELAGRPPEVVLEKTLEKVPEPSLAISSGRGLCLIWQHKPVNRMSLPKWNDAQHSLYRSLKVVGADRQATDAARVFRLVGTVNSKNGAAVRTIHNGGQVYDFEKLAEALPVVEEQDAELYDLRIQRAKRGGFKGPRDWTVESLWESRLTDLQTLRRLRWGRQMDDFKDRWLFLAGVAMSWLVDSYPVLERELLGLAEEIGWSSRRQARQKMAQVFERVVRAARGETIEFKGREWDPRYHHKTGTIIERLEITSEEQREMTTIISDNEYRRRKQIRDNEQKLRKRRAAGSKSAEQYNSGRKSVTARKRADARMLKSTGLSTKEIAYMMGTSEPTVRRYLK